MADYSKWDNIEDVSDDDERFDEDIDEEAIAPEPDVTAAAGSPATSPAGPVQLAFKAVARAAVDAGQVMEAEVQAMASRLARCRFGTERELEATEVLGKPPFFAPHRRCVVHGLASKPELNGLSGCVLPPGMTVGADGSARLPIQISISSRLGSRQMLIRPANLRLVPFDGMSYEDEVAKATAMNESLHREQAGATGRHYKSEEIARARAERGLSRLRFAVGDRVECFIRSARDGPLASPGEWAMGRVRKVDFWQPSFRRNPVPEITVPYQVQLDSGIEMCVQNDHSDSIRAAPGVAKSGFCVGCCAPMASVEPPCCEFEAFRRAELGQPLHLAGSEVD